MKCNQHECYILYGCIKVGEILCKQDGGTNVASFRGLRAAVSVLRH